MSDVLMVRAECCVRCGYRSKERSDFIFVDDGREVHNDPYFGNEGDPLCIKCAIIDGWRQLA